MEGSTPARSCGAAWLDLIGLPTILDGPYLLLETRVAECAALMGAFVRRVEGSTPGNRSRVTR